MPVDSSISSVGKGSTNCLDSNVAAFWVVAKVALVFSHSRGFELGRVYVRRIYVRRSVALLIAALACSV